MRNMRQGPLLILLGIFVLFLLFSVLRRPSSTNLSATDRGNLTIEIRDRIDQGEQKLLKSTGSYTKNLADLTATDDRLSKILSVGVDVSLDASTDGKSYFSKILGTELVLTRERTGSKVVDTCNDLNTGNSIKCPVDSTDLAKMISAENKAKAAQQKK